MAALHRPTNLLSRPILISLACLLLLACGIVFQSTTIVRPDESNTSSLKISINKTFLQDPQAQQIWDQLIGTIRTQLEARGATVADYDDDLFTGITASISFPDLKTLNERLSQDELSVFEHFEIKRWRGEYILSAQTNSTLLKERFVQLTGMGEGSLLLVQFPLNITVNLPGVLVRSNASFTGSDEPETWTINWWVEGNHTLDSASQVELIPPAITSPSSGERIREAGGSVDFAGDGEPGADLVLYRVERDVRTALASGQIDAEGKWRLTGVSVGEPGEYGLVAEERVGDRTALSTQSRLEYRPLAPVIFIPGYYACTRGMTGQDLVWQNIAYGFADQLNATGLFAAAWDVYKPMFDYLDSQGYVINDNLFVACYDWSATMQEEVNDFRQKLDQVWTANRTGLPVTIITHSNGGLIARYYIQNSPAESRERIGNLIMIAPPNQGVVRSYFAWEGGDISWEDSNIQMMLRLTFIRSCPLDYGDEEGTSTVFEAEGIYHCVHQQHRYGSDLQIGNPADTNRLPSLAWLMPTFPFLRDGASAPAKVYEPAPPLALLNTPEQLAALFDGIQGNVYILTGDNGLHTAQELITGAEGPEPLWERGKPTSVQYGQGDNSVLNSSSRLPVDDEPRLIYPKSYPNADHGLGLISQVPEQISAILREETPGSLPPVADNNYLILWVESPLNLLVTAPGGGRIGVDAQGQFTGDLENAVYGDTRDPLGPKFVVVRNPAPGSYQTQVTGVAAGSYRVWGLATGASEPVLAESGEIQPGEEKTYPINYVPPAPGDNSEPGTPGTLPTTPPGAGRSRFAGLACLGSGLILGLVGIGMISSQRRKRRRALDPYGFENPTWEQPYYGDPFVEPKPPKRRRKKKSDDPYDIY